MAHSKHSGPSNKQSKFPSCKTLGNSPKGSAGSLLGAEKLPAGNTEYLEEPKVSRAHGFQPRAHPARCKCTLHSPVGLERFAKITPKKINPPLWSSQSSQLLFLNNKLPVPSAVGCKNQKLRAAGIASCQESQPGTLGSTGKASEGLGPVSGV